MRFFQHSNCTFAEAKNFGEVFFYLSSGLNDLENFANSAGMAQKYVIRTCRATSRPCNRQGRDLALHGHV